MSLTLPKLIYNLRNLIRDNKSDDLKLSDRQLEFIINYYRAKLIDQDLNKKRSISSNIVQDLGNVPVQKIEASESSLVTGNYLLRTTNPIPKLLELSQGDAIVYVGGIDKHSPMSFLSKTRSTWSKHSKYASKEPIVYYRNGYIYISECPNLLKYINIEGIFADPRDVSLYINAGIPCYDVTNDSYPMSEKMIQSMMELIAQKELTFFLQMVPDEVNDASDQIKNSNLTK